MKKGKGKKVQQTTNQKLLKRREELERISQKNKEEIRKLEPKINVRELRRKLNDRTARLEKLVEKKMHKNQFSHRKNPQAEVSEFGNISTDKIINKVNSQVKATVGNFLDIIEADWQGKKEQMEDGYGTESDDEYGTKVIDTNILGKVEFEVFYEARQDFNHNRNDDSFNGTLGIFETNNRNITFKDMLPDIASFFLKEEDKVFLLKDVRDDNSSKYAAVLKHFSVWETLTPFINSKVKGSLPRLRLVDTDAVQETKEDELEQQK